MSYISFINCILAAAVAWIMAGLFTEETHERAAGVLGVVCYSLKRFKTVLRAFSPLTVNSATTTQKRKNGACRHVKRLYITAQPIQAKQKTATAAGLLSGSYDVVFRTMKHSFDKYLWLRVSNPTIYCGMKNREKLRCVCHFWGFQYITGLTGVIFIYGKNFFKKISEKNLGCVCQKSKN